MAIAENDPSLVYLRASDIATLRQLLKMRQWLEIGGQNDSSMLSVAANFWLDVLGSIWSKMTTVLRQVLPIELSDPLPRSLVNVDLLDNATSPRIVRDTICCRCQPIKSNKKANLNRLSARVPDIIMSNRITPSTLHRPSSQYRSPQEIGRELRLISLSLEQSRRTHHFY